MNDLDLKKIEVYAKILGVTDQYVYLRKDEKGFYVEYAFQEGAPHDNRCLSWYNSFQPNAYERNGWFNNLTPDEKVKHLEKIKKDREDRVGMLFQLSAYDCGYSIESLKLQHLREKKRIWKEYHKKPFIPEDHICRVGCPAKECLKTHAHDWTYEEPVKCACWHLIDVSVPNCVSVPIDKAVELFDAGLIKIK